ncbi:MAG TPA: response regulator [Kofleriaceae bacterium]|nr:response regulator [Kofleriaceae bacterium]
MKKTIVIVDDEPGTTETLRDVFEDEGYAVETAYDGHEGLSVLRRLSVRPCVVILDLLMPNLDGIGMFNAMKQDAALADLPVLITTSDPSKAPSGVLIIKKPVDLGILIENVRKCCGTPMRVTGS